MQKFSAERLERLRISTAFNHQLLITKIENLLDSSGIGLDGIAITRTHLRHALQKLQRRLDILMPVHGNKAAGKQLRYGLAGGKPRQHVAVAMFQHANSFQSSTFRKGESRLAVPWSPVHDELVRILAQNDPIVAEYPDIRKSCPQPRCRALPRPGMPNEEVAPRFWPNNSAAMQFQRVLDRQAVRDQQLIERIFQRICRNSSLCKTFFVHLQDCPAKTPVHHEPLIWLCSINRGPKIKLEVVLVFV